MSELAHNYSITKVVVDDLVRENEDLTRCLLDMVISPTLSPPFSASDYIDSTIAKAVFSASSNLRVTRSSNRNTNDCNENNINDKINKVSNISSAYDFHKKINVTNLYTQHEHDMREALWNGRADGNYTSTPVSDSQSLRLRESGGKKGLLPNTVVVVPSGTNRTTSPTLIVKKKRVNETKMLKDEMDHSKHSKERVNHRVMPLHTVDEPVFTTIYSPSNKSNFISSGIRSNKDKLDHSKLEAIAYGKISDDDATGLQHDVLHTPCGCSSPPDPRVLSSALIGVPKVYATANRVAAKGTEVDMWPVFSEMVHNIYTHPLVVSLLVSNKKCRIDKLILRKYDPLLLLHSSNDGTVHEKMIVKAYDPLTSIEASICINLRELVSLLYDLRAKHGDQICRHLSFTSTLFWCSYIKYLLFVRAKPNKCFCLSVSKIAIEKTALALMKNTPIIPINTYTMPSFDTATSDNKIGQSTPTAATSPMRRSNKIRSGSSTKSNFKSSSCKIVDIPNPCSTDSLVQCMDMSPPLSSALTLTLLTTNDIGNSPATARYTNGYDNRTDGFSLSPSIVLSRMPRKEKVARSAIARARDGTSVSAVFRNRALSDIEISLFESPFAEAFVQPKVYKDKGVAIVMSDIYDRAQANQINEQGRELKSSQAHRMRLGLVS